MSYRIAGIKQGVGVEPLFMLHCDRSPVMLTWLHQLTWAMLCQDNGGY